MEQHHQQVQIRRTTYIPTRFQKQSSSTNLNIPTKSQDNHHHYPSLTNKSEGKHHYQHSSSRERKEFQKHLALSSFKFKERREAIIINKVSEAIFIINSQTKSEAASIIIQIQRERKEVTKFQQ